ncbi:MAG: type IV pilus assembly protein PilM [Candidatus Scalindua rubra]|nr:type IV pilus assembly protein PilM [Candidatus Scalindua rubra]
MEKSSGRTTLGIDIGSYWIKVLEFSLTGKCPEVRGLAKKKLPPGMRTAERDPEAVAKLIKECLAEGGISARDVVVMVSGSQVFVRRITMPPMPQDELDEVIPFEATKQVSFSVEQLEVDYIIVGEKDVGGVKNQDILLAATPKEVVEQQKSIIRAAGLRIVAVTVAPMVLWKAFQLSNKTCEDRVIALLDIGHERTTISLLNNGILEFTRTINLGGDEVTSSLMTEPLATGEGSSRTLTYEEAEGIKFEYGLPPSTATGTTTKEGVSPNQIPRLMRPFLERLLSEIRTSFDFYTTEFQIPKVEQIIMSGGGAGLKGLGEFLAGDLEIEIELSDPFQSVDFAGRISKDDIADVASAFVMPLGLAAWENKDLSFLRLKKKAAKKNRGFIKPLVAPSCVAVLIMLVIYWSVSAKLAGSSAELDRKTKEFSSLDSISIAAQALSVKKGQLQTELGSLPLTLLRESADPAWILEEVRRCAPDNTRLEQLSVNEQEGKKFIQIYGTTFFLDERGPALSDFMAALKGSPLFDDVRMISVVEEKSYTIDGLRFQLSCRYNYIGGEIL